MIAAAQAGRKTAEFGSLLVVPAGFRRKVSVIFVQKFCKISCFLDVAKDSSGAIRELVSFIQEIYNKSISIPKQKTYIHISLCF